MPTDLLTPARLNISVMNQSERVVDEFCALSHGYDYTDNGRAVILKTISDQRDQNEWVVDEFCSLSHGYDYVDKDGAAVLKSIIDQHELVAGDRTDQYPGVYMCFNKFGSVLELYDCLVVFVFSKALLKSPAWHTSRTGYGIIDHTSHCPATFEQCTISPDEVVFHHSVSLDYLEYIVAPEEYFDEISAIVGGKWPVYVGNHMSVNHMFDQHCTKLHDQPSYYTNVQFSLAYLVDNDDFEYESHVLKCTMLNMGYSLNSAEYILSHMPIELVVKCLRFRSEVTVHYPVVVQCPY